MIHCISGFFYVWEEGPSGLRCCNKNRNVPNSNLLGTWLGLGSEPCCKVPGDLLVENVENAVINIV